MTSSTTTTSGVVEAIASKRRRTALDVASASLEGSVRSTRPAIACASASASAAVEQACNPLERTLDRLARLDARGLLHDLEQRPVRGVRVAAGTAEYDGAAGQAARGLLCEPRLSDPGGPVSTRSRHSRPATVRSNELCTSARSIHGLRAGIGAGRDACRRPEAPP